MILKAKNVVIGKIIFKASTNHLIAEAYEIPRIYDLVYNRDGEEIGMVVDVLGNVNTPFLAIKPNDKYKDKADRLIGENVFTTRLRGKTKQRR